MINPRCEYDQSIICPGLRAKAVEPDVFGRLAFEHGHGVTDSDTHLLELLAASRMIDGARAPVTDVEDVNELDHLDALEAWCRAEEGEDD